jgi:hypothetical protein
MLSTAGANEKIYTYSVLFGTRLVSYENYNAYERGDMPLSILTIVGASAANVSSSLLYDVDIIYSK